MRSFVLSLDDTIREWADMRRSGWKVGGMVSRWEMVRECLFRTRILWRLKHVVAAGDALLTADERIQFFLLDGVNYKRNVRNAEAWHGIMCVNPFFCVGIGRFFFVYYTKLKKKNNILSLSITICFFLFL